MIRTLAPLLSLSLALLALLAACTTKTKSALSASPTETKAAMLSAFRWQEAHPMQSEKPTDWTNGAFYTGVARAHKATGNPAYLKGIEDMGAKYNWQTWERYNHADDIAIAYAYLYLDEQKPGTVDMAPTKAWIADHLYRDHEWKQGDKSRKEEILWWWCDALFMAPPVLTEYATITKDEAYLDEMYRYYKETYDLLYDKDERLFARDTRFVWTGSPDDVKESNGRKVFWSRGNGWVLGGLALILDEMPKDYQRRPFFVDLFKEMSARVKELQPEDGLWRTSLLAPEDYPHGEASGSGFHVFAIAWGINNGLLSKEEYLPVVTKAWSALRAVQKDDGMVGWVQDIGYDPKPASAESYQNFGTGAFLLAGSEVLKLE